MLNLKGASFPRNPQSREFLQFCIIKNKFDGTLIDFRLNAKYLDKCKFALTLIGLLIHYLVLSTKISH